MLVTNPTIKEKKLSAKIQIAKVRVETYQVIERYKAELFLAVLDTYKGNPRQIDLIFGEGLFRKALEAKVIKRKTYEKRSQSSSFILFDPSQFYVFAYWFSTQVAFGHLHVKERATGFFEYLEPSSKRKAIDPQKLIEFFQKLPASGWAI